jgi:hypothetical protein
MNHTDLKEYNKTFSDNKTDHEYNIIMKKQKKVLYEIEKDELELSIALNMTIQEYRNCVIKETEYKNNRTSAQQFEDRYTLETAFIMEQSYIKFNLDEINIFMNLGGLITPIGKNTAQILEDKIYAGIPGMSRNVVKTIIDYFKIIDINDVQTKYNNLDEYYVDSE